MRPSGISHIVRIGILCAVVVSGAGLQPEGVVHAQKNPQQPKAPPYIQPNVNGVPTLDQPNVVADPVHAKMDEERVKALNDDRHKRLASDVDRLVSLTNELKTDVDKATKDELSVDVIKKAQEIEKLAHDVQSRMKN